MHIHHHRDAKKLINTQKTQAEKQVLNLNNFPDLQRQRITSETAHNQTFSRRKRTKCESKASSI